AAGLFVVLAVTDAVDGYLARSRNEVTNFGKLIDPLADKLLITAALVSLVQLDKLPAWVALVIISREFIVTGLRMVALAEGHVIAAGGFGKLKTVVQIIAIVMFIIMDSQPLSLLGEGVAEAFYYLSWIVMAVALVLTIYSMLDYFYHAREVIELEPIDAGE
ncbi:MAG: CDP-diacylglycerol--glycerol-3-phosphate 3-phosphatidyltransferase, partial [Actinobacteria bacterium HGW-Actinobacteria-9]